MFLITPKTIPDNIELFNSSNDHSKDHDLDAEKHNKSWLMYIDANLEKELSICFFRMVENSKFSQMWQCTIYFSPSFQIMHHKMKKASPASNQSKKIRDPKQGINYKEMILYILNQINILLVELLCQQQSVQSSFFLWTKAGQTTLTMAVTSYKFKIDRVFRLNVTFLHLELLKPEKVEVIKI